MQPIRLRGQLPRTVFLPLLAALLALRVSAGTGRRGASSVSLLAGACTVLGLQTFYGRCRAERQKSWALGALQ